jgi:hypothetical protein
MREFSSVRGASVACHGESGDPFHRAALSHPMADVHEDVNDELG